MFVRVKNVGLYQYLQIAQNRREGKRVRQSVIATLGRLDKLTASGAIDQLLRSAARFPGRGVAALARRPTPGGKGPEARERDLFDPDRRDGRPMVGIRPRKAYG